MSYRYTSLKKTYDVDDEKEIAAKMGTISTNEDSFLFQRKKTIEYFTISKWMKDGRTLDRT